MNETSGRWVELWDAATAAVAVPGPRDRRLQAVCDLLHANVAGYDWVGFYLTAPDEREMLVLGPFAGAPTEHVRIPFGRGVCGRAAAMRTPVVIDDVAAVSNYLVCSPDVKSELVIPIIVGGEVWGELDIDSHRVAAFGAEDVAFLTKLCDLVAAKLAAP